MNIREIINEGPMSRFQIGSLAICVVLNRLDGFAIPLVIAMLTTIALRDA